MTLPPPVMRPGNQANSIATVKRSTTAATIVIRRNFLILCNLLPRGAASGVPFAREFFSARNAQPWQPARREREGFSEFWFSARSEREAGAAQGDSFSKRGGPVQDLFCVAAVEAFQDLVRQVQAVEPPPIGAWDVFILGLQKPPPGLV